MAIGLPVLIVVDADRLICVTLRSLFLEICMRGIIFRSLICLCLATHGLAFSVAAEDKTSASLEIAQAPTFKTGDTWTFRIVDKFHGGVSSTKPVNGDFEITFRGQSRRIFELDGTTKRRVAIANAGALRLMIPTVQLINARSRYFQFPLTVGKKWEGTLIGGKTPLTAEYNVRGIETITTPAGSFQTFKIEQQVSGIRTFPGIGTIIGYSLTTVYFYSPLSRSIVKYHYQYEYSDSAEPTPFRTIDIELLRIGSNPTSATSSSAPSEVTEKAGRIEEESPFELPE